MMSIDAVFPAIGGIGIRVICTVVMFVLTAGRSVGGGVDATGRLACAGPVSTVAFAHGVAVGAVVAAAAEVAGADEDVVAGLAQAAMKNAPAMIAWTGRPVARRSSPMSTSAPGANASLCISSVADPYSRSYSTETTSAGSLPSLRTGTKPAPSLYAMGAPKMKPRDSMPTTTSTFRLP